MGDMAESFRYMNEEKKKRRATLEPTRLEFAIGLLKKHGYHYTQVSNQEILVEDFITLWVYTGWYSGKGIGSGRGIENLIKDLKEKQ